MPPSTAASATQNWRESEKSPKHHERPEVQPHAYRQIAGKAVKIADTKMLLDNWCQKVRLHQFADESILIGPRPTALTPRPRASFRNNEFKDACRILAEEGVPPEELTGKNPEKKPASSTEEQAAEPTLPPLPPPRYSPFRDNPRLREPATIRERLAIPSGQGSQTTPNSTSAMSLTLQEALNLINNQELVLLDKLAQVRAQKTQLTSIIQFLAPQMPKDPYETAMQKIRQGAARLDGAAPLTGREKLAELISWIGQEEVISILEVDEETLNTLLEGLTIWPPEAREVIEIFWEEMAPAARLRNCQHELPT